MGMLPSAINPGPATRMPLQNRSQLLHLYLTLRVHVSKQVYFGLQVIPIWVLCGPSIYYWGTWTLRVNYTSSESSDAIRVGIGMTNLATAAATICAICKQHKVMSELPVRHTVTSQVDKEYRGLKNYEYCCGGFLIITGHNMPQDPLQMIKAPMICMT